MPGKFKVIGTFILKLRNRLIIYGDIVEGTVSSGEELRIPLNSSFAMTVPIESVEAIDGTSSASHIALVVAEDDPLGHNLIESMNFVGETLAIQAPQ